MCDVRFFDNGGPITREAFAAAVGSTYSAPGTNNAAVAVREFRALVESKPLLVVSVADCPQCEELAALLAARGVPGEVAVKWDRGADEYAELKQALSEYAGEAFTFPQSFAEGKYEGGFQDVVGKTEAGVFDELFEREFGAEPQTVKRWVDKKPMVSFSLPNCPQCDILREDLIRRGVPVDEVFIKLDKARPEYPALKAQIQQLSGLSSFTFPQTFIASTYAGNFDEVIKKANAGEYDAVFQEFFGIAQASKDSHHNVEIAFDDDF